MVSPKLITRSVPIKSFELLVNSGIHPLLAKLWVARGIYHPDQIRLNWSSLLPPNNLKNISYAAKILSNSIKQGKRLLIVADYDCDGATACAVGIRALSAMGACVDFLVPNRFKTGYGLSPAVVELAKKHKSGKPDIIITVDNGITSIDGVNAAKASGIDVIITDHHLPGETLPDALTIINPNQPGCSFLSKNLAGVGVMFYLMLALRSEMRRCGIYSSNGGPSLNSLIDLVALGTIVDMVELDSNNRLLVMKGLDRIRNGLLQTGLRALCFVIGCELSNVKISDLSFSLGPRINAAGRLIDMSLGITCLISDDFDQVMEIAKKLDEINRKRRAIQKKMNKQAVYIVNQSKNCQKKTICIYHQKWHQGIIGLVASFLKDKFLVPVLAFAPSNDRNEIKGSGRSIPGIHLRNILELIYKENPGLIFKFGGHAMAVGLTICRDNYIHFTSIFESTINKFITKKLEYIIETDGSLEWKYANIETIELIKKQVWGTGFLEPLFLDNFEVCRQNLIKSRHLKLYLKRNNLYFDAIWFDRNKPVQKHIQAAYRLRENIWKDSKSLQLLIEHIK